VIIETGSAANVPRRAAGRPAEPWRVEVEDGVRQSSLPCVHGMRSAIRPGKTTGNTMTEREQRHDEMRDDPSKKSDTKREIPRGTDEHAKDSTVGGRESHDVRDGSGADDDSGIAKPPR